jgi:hypothetical protein
MATDVDGGREVKQPVRDGGSEYMVGEDVSPLAEEPVAGGDDAALAVAAADELGEEPADEPMDAP